MYKLIKVFIAITTVMYMVQWKVFSKRYMSCSEGCCPYEFCAYGQICYPILRCDVPCPDGSCENGLCMPTKPCDYTTKCPEAYTCSTNFNLGYNTCQYNLDIGRTTCADRKGHSVATRHPSSNICNIFKPLFKTFTFCQGIH